MDIILAVAVSFRTHNGPKLCLRGKGADRTGPVESLLRRDRDRTASIKKLMASGINLLERFSYWRKRVQRNKPLAASAKDLILHKPR